MAQVPIAPTETVYDWIVSVGLERSYWQIQLYLPGHATAKQAKLAAQIQVDELASYVTTVPSGLVRPGRTFTIGKPERLS